MYKELIEKLSQGNQWVKTQPPCSDSQIKSAEIATGYSFPKELKTLLQETDGDGWCLLSAKQIIEHVAYNKVNLLPIFLQEYSKKEYDEKIGRFIFFATNGCGDYYCYRAQSDGVVDETTIYIWEHEMLYEKCCWRPVASCMEEFIVRYYKSEI